MDRNPLLQTCSVSSAPKSAARTPSSSNDKLSAAFERAKLASEKRQQSDELSRQAESLFLEAKSLETAQLGSKEVFDLLQQLKPSGNCDLRLKLNHTPNIYMIAGTVNGIEVNARSGSGGVLVNEHEIRLRFNRPTAQQKEQFYLESTGHEGHRIVFTEDLRLLELRLANVDYCK